MLRFGNILLRFVKVYILTIFCLLCRVFENFIDLFSRCRTSDIRFLMSSLLVIVSAVIVNIFFAIPYYSTIFLFTMLSSFFLSVDVMETNMSINITYVKGAAPKCFGHSVVISDWDIVQEYIRGADPSSNIVKRIRK